MACLAAYIGPEIRLDQLLLLPSHGLLRQALIAPDSDSGQRWADSFGVGWYAEDSSPAVYTSSSPIWNDPNLAALGRSLYGDLWLAALGVSPAPGTLAMASIPPLADQELLFAHDGFLEHFNDLRRGLREFLDPAIEAQMNGISDSEHLFALLRHLLADDPEISIDEAMAAIFELLAEWLVNRVALLNLLVSDGVRLYASRHALNAEPPDLYYSTDESAFPGAQLIASKPLTDSGQWQALPAEHLLILDPEHPPEIIPL